MRQRTTILLQNPLTVTNIEYLRNTSLTVINKEYALCDKTVSIDYATKDTRRDILPSTEKMEAVKSAIRKSLLDGTRISYLVPFGDIIFKRTFRPSDSFIEINLTSLYCRTNNIKHRLLTWKSNTTKQSESTRAKNCKLV